ncbi:MAG: proline--tRNA ligase [Coriobacteriia bacterium]|nr:proline--tRNA ligase [Coriobacteriia bacterium]MCL2750826.1 proline--tRNA ligase [Coriobacteriia bacterium]
MPLIDARLLRMSQLYAPTLKEDPVDAELPSHQLLLRAAMIRKVAAGVYSFLPLGFRVLRKVEQIVREEQDRIGAQEMIMSIIQPAELWHESGRWDVYGPELMRFNDRHDHGFALSPTQEELITSLVRDELRSYRELPKSLYHIQWKYRDEIRPRFGLLRGREFVMKDAYSFHATQESLQEHYDEQSAAYGRICDRLGLEWRPVEADSGQIGGSVTTEFMALAEAGEDGIFYCDCGFAANMVVAQAGYELEEYRPHETEGKLTKLHTPGVTTIEELAAHLSINEKSTVKALAGRDEEGQSYVLFIPGNHNLAGIKIDRILPGFTLLTDEELEQAQLVKGFLGPIGLPEGIRVIADPSLKELPCWLTGANEVDYHVAGATLGRDFSVDTWADITEALPGDACPVCGLPLKDARGIEVGQVFQLGTKYSESMKATFMDVDGTEKHFIMGCYGWGVTRSIAALVEQHYDEQGIIWPMSVTPAEVAVIPLASGDELVEPTAESLAELLTQEGIEVVIDDRDERAGVKFNDADLIGWPFQLIVGKRGLESETVELKVRATGEKTSLALQEAVKTIVALVEEQRKLYL